MATGAVGAGTLPRAGRPKNIPAAAAPRLPTASLLVMPLCIDSLLLRCCQNLQTTNTIRDSNSGLPGNILQGYTNCQRIEAMGTGRENGGARLRPPSRLESHPRHLESVEIEF